MDGQIPKVSVINLNSEAGVRQLERLLGEVLTPKPVIKQRSAELAEKKGYTKLILAVKNREPVHTLVDIVRSGVDVDATDYKGRTAAVTAVTHMYMEHLFVLLRDCRASMSGGYFWQDGFNIFHHLAITGEGEAIRQVGRILAARGDTVSDITRWADETCRIPKCKGGMVSPPQMAFVRLIPAMQKVSIQPMDIDRAINCVRAFVELGSTVLNTWITDVPTLRRPPLHYMCDIGNLMAVAGLVHIGADVNHAIEDDVTPLYIACTKGHVGIASLLLASGANPDAPVKTKSQNGEPCTAREFARLCQFPGIKALFPSP